MDDLCSLYDLVGQFTFQSGDIRIKDDEFHSVVYSVTFTFQSGDIRMMNNVK